jgi:hypothetical protein
VTCRPEVSGLHHLQAKKTINQSISNTFPSPSEL